MPKTGTRILDMGAPAMVDDDHATLRTVAWSEMFPWLVILRTFRLAVGIRALLLGAVAILITLCGWWLLGNMFSLNSSVGKASTGFGLVPRGDWPWQPIDEAVADLPEMPGLEQFEGAARAAGPGGLPANPFHGTWLQLSQPLLAAFEGQATVQDLACLVLCGLWSLATWAFFGAAIGRIAAVQLAADERVGWGSALRFACSKWLSYFGAPLFPLAGMAVAAVPIWLLGWILRADFGVLLVSLAWPLLVLCGLVMAMLLLGLIFGWPLMWATISTEGSDSFDAVARSYHYVFQRPLRYLCYAVVAAILGGIGWLLVKNVAAAVVGMTYWTAGWSAGTQALVEGQDAIPRIEVIRQASDALSGLGSFGAGLIRFWAGCVKLLAVGFIYSYFWTATGAIYLLLRHDADDTEMDEVFLDEDATEPTDGLPPLKTDELGAPVSDEDVPEVEPDRSEE